MSVCIRSDVGRVHTRLLYVRSTVMQAILNASGTKQLNSEMLKRLVRNGAMTPTTALRCVVGSGSSAQILSCYARTAAMTSSTVTDWNWLNDAVKRFGEKDRCGTSDVVDRTPATLSSKKRRNCATPMSAGRGLLPLPSRASIDRHSWPGLDFSASILACQKHSRFRRWRARYSWRLQYHAVVASGVFRQRDDLSNRMTSRLDCRHSPSNQRLDGRLWTVTVFADINLGEHLATDLTAIHFKLIGIEIGSVITMTESWFSECFL